MSRHIDDVLHLIDSVLEERPANGDGPEVASASDEEPATTPPT